LCLVLASLALAGAILAATAFAGESEPTPEGAPATAPYLTQAEIQSAASGQDDASAAPQTDPEVAEELPLEDLGRDDAEKVLTGVFGEVVDAAVEAPGEDEAITRYLSDNVAVVEDPLGARPACSNRSCRCGPKTSAGTKRRSTSTWNHGKAG
jgi:hypothetical protein